MDEKQKYVVLINFITDIGGAQQFCRNKVLELKKRGFEVFVLSATKGTVYIKELEEYGKNFVPELRYPPSCFTKRHIEKTIKRILTITGALNSNTIIDCESITNLEWGELLARDFKCKNIGFLVDESFSPSIGEFDFLKFKHANKSILGTSKQSLKILFQNHLSINDDECYCFHAYCSNVVDDIPFVDPFEKDVVTVNKSATIGIFGRLDKPFVVECSKLLKSFIIHNRTVFFNVLFIGGGSKKSITALKKLFSNLSNMKLAITDYMFPVPRGLLKKLDVCFSTAASARVVANEGVPTIYLNCNNGIPVGIMNYTIDLEDDQVARYSEEYKDFNQILKQVLFDNYCAINPTIRTTTEDVFSTLLEEEIDYELSFIRSNKQTSYYDCTSITLAGKKQLLFKFFGKLFGGKGLYFFHMNFFKKMTNLR